jgi:hypothetical protein
MRARYHGYNCLTDMPLHIFCGQSLVGPVKNHSIATIDWGVHICNKYLVVARKLYRLGF